jgi:hypothetical protein
MVIQSGKGMKEVLILHWMSLVDELISKIKKGSPLTEPSMSFLTKEFFF